MTFDDTIASALTSFAKVVRRTAEAPFIGFLSAREAQDRRERLHELATDAEALAEHYQAATYRAFERLLAKARGLGANIPNETIIAVGSAFINRPYVRPKV
jgi:hypothetical protein